MVSKQFSSGMPWNQSFLRANANQVPGPAEVILFSAPYWARVYGVFVIPSHTYWCYWLLFNLSKLFFFRILQYFTCLQRSKCSYWVQGCLHLHMSSDQNPG